MNSDQYFKGWRIPGPRVPGGEVCEEGQTLDALSGFFKIFQLKDGHRFSTDDLLVAWYGSHAAGSVSKILDLGSGIGTVAQIAAWKYPQAKIVTVEAQEESVLLARKSIRYNGLEGRFDVRHSDLRNFDRWLNPNEKFDLVLSSPPYFPLGTGVLGDHPQKIACRFEVRGDISDYAMAAARTLNSGGVFAGVFPWETKDRVEEALVRAGLVILKRRPVILKEGEEPLLHVFAAGLKSDTPEGSYDSILTETPLLIRLKNGRVSDEYVRVKSVIGFPP